MKATTADESDAQNAPGGKNPRGRPTAETSELHMSRLMEIGLRHFLQYGLKSANILAIAEEAGVTRQMIYNHFGSKTGFFEAVSHNRDARVVKDWLFDIEHDEREPIVVIQSWVERTLAYQLDDERIALARAQMGGLYGFPELAKEEWSAHKRIYASIAKYLLNASQKAGVTLKIEPLRAAANLAALMMGVRFPVLLGATSAPSRAKQKQLANEITILFLRGIGFSVD